MIDPNLNITNQLPLKGDFNIPKNPAKEQETPIPADTFNKESSRSEGSSSGKFIVIPPKNVTEQTKQNSLFKTTNPSGGKNPDVQVEKKLDVINGYVARIDEGKKEDLQKAGYLIFEDVERQWLPDRPNPFIGLDNDIAEAISSLSASQTGATKGAGKTKMPKLVIKMEDRPKLDGPRFDTPLSRQYTGEGVTIATIDTGIYPHPDFTSPKNRIKKFIDHVNNKSIPYDDNGHGTHVHGDASGSGLMSNGLYRGTAPGTDIVSIKALSASGGGSLSAIIASIQDCIKYKDELGIRVINMSLGHTGSENYWEDPVNLAVKAAFDAGLLVIAAAGNEGPEQGTVGTPGDNPFALSVGAFDDNNTTKDPSDDKMTGFSSVGPTPGGLMKPDVIAPGEAIIAPVSPGTSSEAQANSLTALNERMKWYAKMPDEVLMSIPKDDLKRLGLPPQAMEAWYKHPLIARKIIASVFENTKSMPITECKSYQGMPGTSMAAPIVAGIAAQIFQANPDLSPGQVMEIIKKTADKLPGNVSPYEQGNGSINPEKAIQLALDVKEGKEVVPEPHISWPADTVQMRLPFMEETK